MKKIMPPLIAYLVVCLIAIFLPASEGYNTVGWKLFVGQIYAIPVLIIVALFTFFRNKKALQQ
ncbi:hypothetical protein QE429_000522 [Bacillus sp. SORGH_AS 510]|uniref:DUF4017 family protein n=1 Tax=Bacillus sp. SORGH_AS_0510 TaxID=3041771 RepID=UPI0027851A8F|nr:DUF4017 family protein [Bacillus sp. SORGH_AS_0510]MDQ1143695.1 hypothetical protein [Bacillus sp. SORGH_AS_0510]